MFCLSSLVIASKGQEDNVNKSNLEDSQYDEENLEVTELYDNQRQEAQENSYDNPDSASIKEKEGMEKNY